jgi:hypothetical protein
MGLHEKSCQAAAPSDTTDRSAFALERPRVWIGCARSWRSSRCARNINDSIARPRYPSRKCAPPTCSACCETSAVNSIVMCHWRASRSAPDGPPFICIGPCAGRSVRHQSNTRSDFAWSLPPQRSSQVTPASHRSRAGAGSRVTRFSRARSVGTSGARPGDIAGTRRLSHRVPSAQDMRS